MHGKADIDNLIKLVLDSLNGHAYIDDTQVVSLRASKKYARGDGDGRTTVRLTLLSHTQEASDEVIVID